jgi:hypothetical protein
MYYFERYQHSLVAYLQTVRTTNAVECRISLLKLLYDETSENVERV